MRKKPELPEVEPVKLHPIFGIRPGIVILSSIIAIIIIVLFLLLVLPGLIQKGGYVRFSLNTSNTAIYSEDGHYIGSSEGSVYYLPHGRNTFYFSIDGADAGSITVDVPHHIFFTLFHHSVLDVGYDVSNTPEIEEAVKRTFASDIALWSKVIDYSDSYHYPLLFEKFARNAVALGFENISDEIAFASLHVSSSAMESDLRRAVSILEESNVEYESETLNLVLLSLEGNLLPTDEKIDSAVIAEKDGSFFFYPEMTITIGNSDSSSFPDANERAVNVAVGAFSIAERPVTEYEYALFVEENPYWSPDNKENLILENMVDEGYLNGVSLSTRSHSTYPIRNISYRAAEAYVEWLSEKDGVNYMIPSEAEWTLAAMSARSKRYATSLQALDNDQTSPSFMLGQLWEMTSTSYMPLSRIDYEEAERLSRLYDFDDIVVKGGSYINDPSLITIDTVGAMDRSATSEYATLRIGIR